MDRNFILWPGYNLTGGYSMLQLQVVFIWFHHFHRYYVFGTLGIFLMGWNQRSATRCTAMRGATVPPNTVHLNGCLDACSKADAWEEALALFGSLEV